MNNTLSLSNALRSGLDDINQDLYKKCDTSKYSLDLMRYENRDKDAVTYDEKNNYDIILCLYYNKKCISSVVGRYHAKDNSIEILSKTHTDFENKKFNLYLRSAFIYLMCFVRPSIRNIYSFSENPISTYTMYKYFQVYNEDLNDFIIENHLTPNTFTVKEATKFHDYFKNKYKKTRESSELELKEMLEDYTMEELGWESEEEAIDFIMNTMNRTAIPLSLSLENHNIKDFLLSILSNTMIKCNETTRKGGTRKGGTRKGGTRKTKGKKSRGKKIYLHP
jgi:hypothetical protein